MNLSRNLIGAVALFASTMAFAGGTYEAESKKVDAAIAASKQPASTTDEARKMFADSQRMMKEGKEAEAMRLLDEVKKLLKMK